MDEPVKMIFTILLFFCLKVSAQYTAHWESSDHTTYEVQQGLDTFSFYTIATIPAQLSDSIFTATVPGPNYYYRIVADKDTSDCILVYAVLSIKPDSVYRPQAVSLGIKVINEGYQLKVVAGRVRDELISYALTDIAGRVLESGQWFVSKGLNTFYLPFNRPHGIYIIDFRCAYENVVKKVIK